jgi:hypothetical protein
MSIERRQSADVGWWSLALAALAVCSCGGPGASSRGPQSSASAPYAAAGVEGAPTASTPGAVGVVTTPRDAELIVHRDVVARCPTLRLVRAYAGRFDPDVVWVAVLDAISDCMREGGSLAHENLGVSGDESHRHVVRQVLESRGIAPIRVVATRLSDVGAAECQGGVDCVRRVEITIGAGAPSN